MAKSYRPLLLGLCLQASIGAAQNLAQNPGFETGNTSGWFAFGPATISAQTAQVHSGTRAALVQNRSATWHGIGQSFLGALQPGSTNNISAWVRIVSGASQTISLTMKKVDGNGTTYAMIGSGSGSTNNWTSLAGQYTLDISGTLTELTLYFESPSSATVEFYVDDLLVEAIGSPPVSGYQCTVDWTNVFQRIDGFGASSAWRGSWTTAQADMFFSTNTGIGLSLLRTRIAPGATTIESSIMQMAQARGARVWSAPWSPQTSFKSTNNDGIISVNGGSFIGTAANYQAYANQLAGYVANVKNAYGVNLYAISVQNEADFNTTGYESCVWTGQQIHDFVPYLSSALAASNAASTRIMLPESIHWSSNPGLYTPAMTDPSVAPLVGIIANHNYDGPNFQTGATSPPSAINSYGKALWETEVSTGDPFDGSITNAVYWAGRIHLFLTVAQANAYHYWWLLINNGATDNEALCDLSGNPAKRMYAMGNFSRFVRPNFYRIGVVSNTGPLQISAYKEPDNGAVAIVVINPGTNSVTQTFDLSGFGVTNLTPWLTSASASLASQTPVAVSGASFTNTIPALSIVTFVGQAVPSNSPPANISLSNSAVGENQPSGVTVGSLTTTDPNAGNTFTYALVGGVGSANNGSFSISGSNLLTAASFNYEAQSSFSVRIRSTDQGALFTEKAFNVTVTNVNEAPSLTPVSDLTIGAGVVLAVTNTATDPEVPTQTLTFSLLTSPTNATIGANSGLFTWRPLIAQANTTNLITVQVADNGTPVLRATNRFAVTVNPINQPTISSISLTAEQVILLAAGAIGPDYTLLTSTNLAEWQSLFTTNPSVMPMQFSTTNSADLQRYYRLQLGP